MKINHTRSKVLTLILIFWICFSEAAVAAPQLIYGNGEPILFGANGVDVGGKKFDVRFVTMPSQIYGYPPLAPIPGRQDFAILPSFFTFNDQNSAYLASQALLDQVFVDASDLLAFDSQPWLTYGCQSVRLSNGSCYEIITPYEVDRYLGVVGFGVNNRPGDMIDDIWSRGAEYYVSGVYASWTASVVSEPSPLVLIAIALGALAAMRRGKSISM
jgi:hypothetical protein